MAVFLPLLIHQQLKIDQDRPTNRLHRNLIFQIIDAPQYIKGSPTISMGNQEARIDAQGPESNPPYIERGWPRPFAGPLESRALNKPGPLPPHYLHPPNQAPPRATTTIPLRAAGWEEIVGRTGGVSGHNNSRLAHLPCPGGAGKSTIIYFRAPTIYKA